MGVEPWTTLSTQRLFADPPWIELSVEQVRVPDGRVIDNFYQVRLPDHIVAVALTRDGYVVVERQYRHGARRTALTLPSGMIEEGEEPVAAAKRELLEETGYVAEDWRCMGSFVMDGNRGCGIAHLFSAAGAHQVAEPDPGGTEDLDVLLIEPEALMEAARGGEVVVLSSMAALVMALTPMFNGKHPH